jgi:hypothetical protein
LMGSFNPGPPLDGGIEPGCGINATGVLAFPVVRQIASNCCGLLWTAFSGPS